MSNPNDKRTKMHNPGNMPYQPEQTRKSWEHAFKAPAKVRVARNIKRTYKGRFTATRWDGKAQRSLGTFDTLEEAIHARDMAESEAAKDHS